MKKLIILALAAMLFAACSNQPVQQNKSFMDLARQRYAVREYAQTPVEQAKLAFELPANHEPSFLMPCGYASENAKPSDHHFSRKPISEAVTYK